MENIVLVGHFDTSELKLDSAQWFSLQERHVESYIFFNMAKSSVQSQLLILFLNTGKGVPK